MFKYDSTHGTYKRTIKVIDEFTLEIDGKVSVTSKRYAIDMAYGCILFSVQAYGYYDLIHDS
jgi:glyceraldehyde 3-phosphate dehydrogenase